MSTEPIIRHILQKDSKAMGKLIQDVFGAMDIPKVGTAYGDAALDNLYRAYQKPKAAYFVVESAGEPIGGAGISSLEKYSGNVCELQKMYLSEASRGRGIGSLLLEKCLERARNFGYSGCYLETMPKMKAAQALYQKHGFAYIREAMGCTGHYSCQVYMFTEL